MSKDKGSKNVKKAPAAEGKKGQSNYQSEKKSVSAEASAAKKK